MSGRVLRWAGTHLALGALVLVGLVPLLWMVAASLKPLGEVGSGAFLPRVWRPGNYAELFRQVPFARYYANSLFVAAWVTFLQCLTSAMAAFAFARLRWTGRDATFRLYLATMMIPGAVTMIPNYTLMVRLHLLDSFTGLIVPSAFGAFGTFMLRQFMLTIPAALDEAATIDGAGHWTVFIDVVMPLVRPALVTLGLFTFLGTYGSLFWPLVLIKSEHLRTLPIGMMAFDSQYGKQTNLMMAASVVSIAPPLLLFLLGQKHIVTGIRLGAVKG